MISIRLLNRSLFLLLVIAGFLQGLPVWAGTTDDEGSCEHSLESREKSPQRQLRVRIANRLDVPNGRWISWHREGDHLWLASLDSANTLRVFEPAKGDEPIYSGRWSSADSQVRSFSRAEWVPATPGAPMIQVGDDRGNLVTFDPFRYPDPSVRFQGSHVSVEPHSVELKDGGWLTAMSLKDLQRVRIVPVGRWDSFWDISIHGEILAMAAHKTSTGEALLSVIKDSSLEILKLGDGQGSVYAAKLKGTPSRPVWTVDASGESMLAVVDVDSQVHLVFPESRHEELIEGSQQGSIPKVLFASSQKSGTLMMVENLKPHQARLFEVKEKKSRLLREIDVDLGFEELSTLIAPAMGEPWLVTSRSVEGRKVLSFSRAEDPESPPVTLELDHPNEIIKSYAFAETEKNKKRLAVQTNLRIYNLEIW